MSNRNCFLKLRNLLEGKISNKVKEKTGNDLFDWVNIFILFGGGAFALALFVLKNILSLREAISAIILWFTAFVIVRYTKETYYLKKIAQKQFITSIRPYLRLQWEKGGGLVLVNEGKGVAKDLEPIYRKGGKEYKMLSITAMAAAPGSQTRGLLLKDDSNKPNFEPLKENHYSVELVYKDIEDRGYTAFFEVDMDSNDKFRIVWQDETEKRNDGERKKISNP